jgi:4-amino-4-deoxy-L-arabinose transferase-like glycosyltransferase
MNKINWKTALFFGVIVLAVFLRVYNFNDWNLAKGDQVRDAMVALRAQEGGVEELPLLGPRAGGTQLHLGPVYYYFLYGSSVVVGNVELPATAYPNLIFSLFSIAIFYFFAREYFNKNWTMVLTGMFALSYLGIEHARFAWNPNSTLFFALLFCFALLKIFKSGKEKNLRWAALAGLAYAIGSQMHFTFFITFPVITVLFLAFNYKKILQSISWKQVAVFFGIIIFFYIPVIISDVLNNGENFRRFFSSIGSKSSDHSFWENLQKDFYYFGKYFFRIMTGYFGSNEILHYVGSLFAVLGAGFSVWMFQVEKDENKRNFISLILIVFSVFFLVYIPLAYSIDKPRFYLSFFFVPYIFAGVIARFVIEKYKQRWLNFLFLALATIVVGANVFAVSAWFAELRDSLKNPLNPKDTIILKTKKDAAWWLWEHFENASQKIKSDCPKKNVYYAFSKKIVEFEDTFDYAITYNDKSVITHSFKLGADIPQDSTGCYYYIFRTGDEVPEKLQEDFSISDDLSIGSMGILSLKKR